MQDSDGRAVTLVSAAGETWPGSIARGGRTFDQARRGGSGRSARERRQERNRYVEAGRILAARGEKEISAGGHRITTENNGLPALGTLRIESRENQHRENDGEHTDHAALRAHISAGKPARTVKCRSNQCTRRNGPTVGRGKDKGLGEVPPGVQADGEPQSSRAAQGQAEKHRNQKNLRNARPSFSAVGQVNGSEQRGDDRGRGPKADAVGECRENVAAKEKFLP